MSMRTPVLLPAVLGGMMLLLGPPDSAPQTATDNASPSSQQGTAPQLPRFGVETIVTAERAPGDRDRQPSATAVLTRQEIESRPAVTLADVASTLPGFQVLAVEGVGLPSSSIARGFFGGGEAEYVKVLVDGVPLGDVESGVVDWRRLPVFSIDRVEGVRGPASAAYGDTALAGAIQVFTIRSSAAVRRASVTAGSLGSFVAAAEIGQPLGDVVIQAVGSHHRSAGFRHHAESLENFLSASAHRAGAHQWTARGSFSTVNRDEPGALSAAQLNIDRRTSDEAFRLDGDTTRRGHGALRYRGATDAWTYGILVYANGRTGSRLRTLLLAPGFSDSADRKTSSRAIGTSFENSVAVKGPLVPGQLQFGVDASVDRLDTSYRRVVATGSSGAETAELRGRRSQLAGYAAYWMNAGDRATLHAGVRWDGLRYGADGAGESSHQAWSPRLGATVAVGEGVVLFGQASRAFKAPTLDQLYDPRPFPDFRGGTFVISAPTLRPQRASNLEGGIRQSVGRHRWEAVVYRMNVRDEIDFDPATFTYANIGRSTHEGAELDFALFRDSAVSFGGDYAWTRVAPDLDG
jgi:outer membrane cobalamin receptor